MLLRCDWAPEGDRGQVANLFLHTVDCLLRLVFAPSFRHVAIPASRAFVPNIVLAAVRKGVFTCPVLATVRPHVRHDVTRQHISLPTARMLHN
jgi:hypothetical protein